METLTLRLVFLLILQGFFSKTYSEDLISCEDSKIDLVFVIDSSTSVGESNYQLGRDFMKDLLLVADIDNGNVRVGAVVFSNAAYIQFHLDKYKTKAELFQAISAIPYISGWTNTADGLRTMRTTMFSPAHGDRPNVPNIAVVITDGQSNTNRERTIPEAEAAKDQGIQIYAIGVGAGITEELNNIASKPVDDFRFTVQDYKQLKDLKQKLFSAICAALPPVTKIPTTPKPVVIRRVNTRFDLVFVLDAISSVSKSNFDLMIKFIKDFIYADDIYNENVRIGVVTSSNSHIQFHLDKHRTKDDIINDTDAIAYPPNDNTNTADAIRTMTAMFNESNGDRLDVDNIAIVLTTGVSNSQNIQAESDAARTQGIHIFVVGIGLRDTTQLDVIANKPLDQNRFTVKDFTDLEDLKENVFSAVLTQMLENKKNLDNCPLEPTSVHLEVATDIQGIGKISCSLAEHPPDKVQIRFFITVFGEETNAAQVVNSPERTWTIPLSELSGEDKSLFDKKIYCIGEVRFLKGEWCHTKGSNVISPAIMCPAPTQIKLVEGQGYQNVLVKLTAPPAFFCVGKDGGQCELEVVINTVVQNNELRCSKDEIIPQIVFGIDKCTLKFTRSNWKNGITIPVKANIDRILDGDRVVTIQTTVKFTGLENTEESCPDIQATVVDRDKASNCYSVNDPHIATFDKYNYDNQLEGEFILYKHKNLPYQVNVDYRPCVPHLQTATCNCAAAIQSGSSVIVFNSCDAKTVRQDATAMDIKIFSDGELTPGTKVRQLGGGQQYEVQLPTGTVVTVMPSQATFMNVFITASPADFKMVEGMCGNFNGVKDDDVDNLSVDNFNIKWKATKTIFCGVSVLSNDSAVQSAYSSCTGDSHPVLSSDVDVFRCSSSDVDSNEITKKIPVFKNSETTCKQLTRRKRQASVPNPSPTKMTLTEAQLNCSGYLESSAVVKACTEQLSKERVTQSVSECAYDLMSTGLFDWAVSHVSNLAEECITRAEQNQSSWTGEGDTPGEPVFPQAIVTQLCVRDCGDNGHCVNSFCRCKNGYFGESCQFGPNTVPLIFGADKTCNIQESSCEAVRIDGDFFTSSDNLACHINFAAVDTRARKTESSAVVRAEYISMYQVGCTLPTRRSAYITVTNDGVRQSENVYLHVVHNSSCQTCVINDNKTDVDCHMITNVCVIEGQCYFQQQEDNGDSCNFCDPNSSNIVWTRKTDSACKEVFSNEAIIAISVGCAVFGLLLIFVVIIVMIKKRRAGKSAYNVHHCY
ncbi:von Willebrand factor D and EGF domain-containing protein-like isoform X2 [Physella acuta]|uniref:von Willebrand factor D and EGF domain-containing protein-like isoform X2 n=1 Tax=Physella acuta TaxID=109671 RepID=UPI0027DE041E|nr:von Willebrand factor D and EGF domain-containing protein-like isoform X2 [Physella acuta]